MIGMKYLGYLFIIFFLSASGILAQKDRNVKAYLNEKQFFAPGQGNYIEVQLNFVGYSLNYIDKEEKTVAEVQITQLFSQQDEIVRYDKYVLESPEVIDSIVENFHDIQRFSLDPGEYMYELEIKDIHSKHEAISVKKKIEIVDLGNRVSISEITPAENVKATNPENTSIFSKMGYDIVPMTSNYYPTELEWLPFYVEVYNTNDYYDDSVYVVEQRINGLDN